jgi:hypothetical protein
MGRTEPNGYAKICIRIKPKPASPKNFWLHRIAYVVFHGEEIPAGYDVDHKCKYTLCINPEHLRAIPLQENRTTATSFKKKNPGKQISFADIA